MPLLYYWRPDNYRRDLDQGAAYHLNQATPTLHAVDLGESLWAFTRSKKGRYVLAAELVVRAKTYNSLGFHYGRYRVWGDLNASRYFEVEEQPSAEPLLRTLSIPAHAARLGQSFQGPAAVRVLTVADDARLRACARSLPLEPRACLLPEERLEAHLIVEDAGAIEQLLRETASGIAPARREYLVRQAPARNTQLVRQLHKLYDGRCQLCGWHPQEEFGFSLCQGHHIQWLSRGGEDTLSNMMLVCPNHHAAIHRCDAALDFDDLSLDFGMRREALQLNRHLRS